MSTEDFQKIGFKVMALTKHSEGLSFDAHWIGRKRVIRGAVGQTPEAALNDLYIRCERIS
jgi:hypothetical protein